MARAQQVWVDAGGAVDAYTVVTMARFCVGNKWNERRVSAQLRRAAAWRKETNAAAYRASFVRGKRIYDYAEHVLMTSVIAKLVWCGSTRDGHPVDYVSVGAFDPGAFLARMSDDDWWEANLQLIEYEWLNMDRCTLDRADGVLLKAYAVIDLDGLRLSQLSLGVLRRIRRTAPLFDSFYPEILGVTCLLNTPAVFQAVWAMVRSLVSKEIQDTMQLHAKGSTDLVAHIEPGWVPACYGGDMKQLRPEGIRALGLDALDRTVLASLLPGPVRRMGRLHLPPEEALALEPAPPPASRGRSASKSSAGRGRTSSSSSTSLVGPGLTSYL
eukprot:6643386-Prymnesium_polylepis.1